jgi:hypothetical protein
VPQEIAGRADVSQWAHNGVPLTWASDSPGTLYDVTVLDEDLQVLFKRHGLMEPNVVVPASALASQSPGRVVFWFVMSRGADTGARGTPSPTWSVVLP